MANNIDQMEIQKIVIHQVFRRESKESIIPPLYNNVCSDLDDKSIDALHKRFVKSLGDNSNSMKMEIVDTGESSVFKYISNFWLTNQEDDNFIMLSKELTRLLTVAQSDGRIPGGVVVVVKGIATEYKKDFIAIIKAEKHDGFNITQEEGKNLFKYFNNIVLSPQQKLHKLGYFVNNAVKGRSIEKKDVDAFVYDSNTSAKSISSYADYFYNRFLGLNFRTDAEFITNKFFLSTRDFINTCVQVKTDDKIIIQEDLRNYLETTSTSVINPNDFIRRTVMDGTIIDKYLEYVNTQGVPLRDTKKHLALVNKSMKERRIAFENRIKLYGPSESFKENVSIEEKGADTIIIIKGKYLSEK